MAQRTPRAHGLHVKRRPNKERQDAHPLAVLTRMFDEIVLEVLTV